MDSETSAYASAQQKHNKYMVFGKKHRYIEVFQCSGDDMNLVLHGGLHPPANTSKPALLSPGMLTTAQQPQHSQSLPSHSHHSITVPPPLTLSIPPTNPALIAQQQAQFIAQQNLIARQQAAAAAAHHNEQMFLQNFGLLHPQQHHQQSSLLPQPHHPHHQQQFLLMQRPMLPQLPVGFMPPSWMQFGGHPGMVAAAQMAQQQVQQQVQPGSSMPTTTKRRYENAFQPDPNAMNIPKRTFTTQPGLYPFYPPNV